jgi:carboxyl-terminal processing protease
VDAPHPHPGDDADGLGIYTSPGQFLAQDYPAAALPPLYVRYVAPGSPAARAGVRPGDVITAVNGSAPFTDGTISPGVISLLYESYPQQQPVRITLRWPVTGATRTITLTPAPYKLAFPLVTSKLLAGHIGYVKLLSFPPGAARQVLAAISALQQKAALRGLILDLRYNGGGDPAEDTKLLGAFEHGKPYDYYCTVTGKCTANYPDSHTPLLHLRLAVLTDRNCESACDAFTGAVKDLHLGTLIGTRTGGIAAGPQTGYPLNDGSFLAFPHVHMLGAGHEIINGIGVAADYYLPATAKDVATGHDPDIAKALALLGRSPGTPAPHRQASAAGREQRASD